MPTKLQIGNQLAIWVRKWGAYHDEMGRQLVAAFCTGAKPKFSAAELQRNAELADFRLRSWPTRAADELEALLVQIGVDPRAGNLEARAHNEANCPDTPPMQLIDLLTVLHDLRVFGPRPEFRPDQTFEAVFKFIRAFSRTV